MVPVGSFSVLDEPSEKELGFVPDPVDDMDGSAAAAAAAVVAVVVVSVDVVDVSDAAVAGDFVVVVFAVVDSLLNYERVPSPFRLVPRGIYCSHWRLVRLLPLLMQLVPRRPFGHLLLLLYHRRFYQYYLYYSHHFYLCCRFFV